MGAASPCAIPSAPAAPAPSALTAGGRGLQVMTAIAVSPGGVGLASAGTHFWRRALTRIKDTRARRKFAQKESRF
nr:hypothetical protein [Deltaproteobacteria bacterium]